LAKFDLIALNPTKKMKKQMQHERHLARRAAHSPPISFVTGGFPV
jgi:hypothetical protein